jgi:hypothetical protein
MIGKYIGKYLLRFFVVTLILVYGLSVVTEYNTLRPIVSDFSTKLVNGNLSGGINQNMGEEIMVTIDEYCKNNDVFSIQGFEGSTINCKDVQSKGVPYISEFMTDNLMKDYYKEYDCSPIGCLKNIIYNRSSENMMFIFSAKMNLFLKSLIPFLILGTLLSIGIIVRSIKEKFEISREVGVTLIGAAGVPFLILLLIRYKDKILKSTGIVSGNESLMRTTADFFSGPIYNVSNMYLYLYGLVFIIGSILFMIGYYGYKRKSGS